MVALTVASSVLVGAGGQARADLGPLPNPGPLPIPRIFGPSEREPKQKPRQQPRPEAECSTAVSPFVPETLEIPVLQGWVPVLAMRRDRNGVPGTPPTTSRGRGQVAFDLDNIRPGSRRGNALLNAHTWPDGTALGNALLAELNEGDELTLTGPDGIVCYEVTDRIEVRASSKKARDRFFDTDGKPQIAIIVCSGKRLGPGQWTHRTMWFADPMP